MTRYHNGDTLRFHFLVGSVVDTRKEPILKEGKAARPKIRFLHKPHICTRVFQIFKKHSPLLREVKPLGIESSNTYCIYPTLHKEGEGRSGGRGGTRKGGRREKARGE